MWHDSLNKHFNRLLTRVMQKRVNNPSRTPLYMTSHELYTLHILIIITSNVFSLVSRPLVLRQVRHELHCIWRAMTPQTQYTNNDHFNRVLTRVTSLTLATRLIHVCHDPIIYVTWLACVALPLPMVEFVAIDEVRGILSFGTWLNNTSKNRLLDRMYILLLSAPFCL